MNEITNIFTDVSFNDGGWIMLVPVTLMGVDVLTGIIHAWATGHLKSYKMREGLGRKFGEIMILFIGQLFTAGMNFPFYLLSAFSLYIILMEIVSICENLKKLGVPIPKFVDKALTSMNEEIQNGGGTSNNEGAKTDGDEKSKN